MILKLPNFNDNTFGARLASSKGWVSYRLLYVYLLFQFSVVMSVSLLEDSHFIHTEDFGTLEDFTFHSTYVCTALVPLLYGGLRRAFIRFIRNMRWSVGTNKKEFNEIYDKFLKFYTRKSKNGKIQYNIIFAISVVLVVTSQIIFPVFLVMVHFRGRCVRSATQ